MRLVTILQFLALTTFAKLEALQIGSIFIPVPDDYFPTTNIETVSFSSSICKCKLVCMESATCRGVICTKKNDNYLARTFSSPDIPLVFDEKTKSFCKINGNCSMPLATIDLGIQSYSIRLIDVAHKKPVVSFSQTANGLPEKAVDGDLGTWYHAALISGNNEWISIDLKNYYYVYQIKIDGRSYWKNRYGDFKAYLSNEFDAADDFSTYPEILEVVGTAASDSETYNCTSLIKGRFLTIYRTITGLFEASEVQVLAIA